MSEGQAYSPIAGLYRQFPLYYLIGDERDIVRVCTNYHLEDVYLYRGRPPGNALTRTGNLGTPGLFFYAISCQAPNTG